MPEAKVYKVDECTWMAGYDAESCAQEALRLKFVDILSLEAFGKPQQVSDGHMDKLQLDNEEACGGPATRTFREQLNADIARGAVFPIFFATTEY